MTFTWKGYEWTPRTSSGAPTYNGLWDPANAYVDTDGSLVLKITNPTGSAPYAAEVASTTRGLGYGTYQYTVSTNFDSMGKSIVFGGLFTYDDTQPAGASANEIDAGEISAWGVPGEQPSLTTTWWVDGDSVNGPGHFNPYNIPMPTGVGTHTHVVVWRPGRITFRAYKGAGTGGELIASGSATHDVPKPANEQVRFNMWVTAANADNEAATAPFTARISDFSFTPHGDITMADSLMLEVEDDPSGLVNLVQNPSGELGGWGWVTPVSGSVMKTSTAYGQALEYDASPGVANWFYTEALPVTPGQYVAASFVVPSVASYYRASFEFLDSSQAVLATGGQTTQSGYTAASASTVSYGSYVVPAGASFARLRFDLYSSTAGAAPATGSQMTMQQVTVAKASSSSQLVKVIRENLVTNPSFEVDTSGWSAKQFCTIARSTAQAYKGTASLAVTGTATVPAAAVTSKALSSNVATLGVPNGHYFRMGEPITVAGVGSPFDGAATITAFTSTSISFARTGSNVATTNVTSGTATVTSTGNPATTYGPWTVYQKSIIVTNGVPRATLTVTSSTMQLRKDNGLTVSGVGAPFDGTWVAASSSSNSVSFDLPAGTPAMSGTSASGTVTKTSSADEVEMVVQGPTVTVDTSKKRAGQIWARSATVGRKVWLGYREANYASYVPDTWVGSPVTTTTAGWAQAVYGPYLTANAPSSPIFVTIRGKVGEVHYLDAAMFEQADTVGTYFDGSTTGATGTQSYRWSGTANNSTSQLIDSQMGYVAPVPYLDVLGDSVSVEVVREALNPGTLQAEVLSSSLDPSQGSLIQPGRRVRLSALVGGSSWETIFSGKVSEASVRYELKDPTVPDEKRARITVSAVDNVAALANTTRPEGVATVDDLPWVLEGAGVPWVCNGSSNQVASAAVASINENASALDQVALTRDSRLAKAWIDRNGVLQAWDFPPGSQANQVANPDFETDASWWQANYATVTRDTSRFHSGTASAKVVASATGASRMQSPWNPGWIRLRPATTYQVSAWFRVETALSVDHVIVAEYYNAAGTYIGGAGTYSTPLRAVTGGWVQQTLTFTTPVGTGYGVIYVPLANGTNTAADTVWVDDVSLSEVASAQVVDESDYSEFDVSFSTADLINEVRVTLLAAQGADTSSTPYGPYTNQASIDKWGRYSAEFTVHGLTPAQVDQFAAEVLAANSTPAVRVNSVVVPVTDASLAADRASLDLYDLLDVRNTQKGLQDLLWTTGVRHSITPDKWLVTLEFSDEGGVAAPTAQPPVQTGVRPDVGKVEMFAGPVGGAGSKLPAGHLLCDGASYLVADYPYLFAVIGYTHGGSGSSFNVPNLVDFFPIGAGSKALGTQGGSATKTIASGNLPKHTHTINHDHGNGTIPRKAGAGTAGGVVQGNSTAGTSDLSVNVPTYSGSSGDGGFANTPMDVMNPWRALNFIIRAV